MIIFFIVLAISFALYLIHVKDVYFAYGQAVAFIYRSRAKVTYDEDGTLTFEFPNGGQDVYVGYMSSAVLKLLKKKGIINDSHFESSARPA